MNKVWSIIEDGSNMLWVGTHGGGLNCFDPETETFVNSRYHANYPYSPNSPTENYVDEVYVDRRGAVWLGTHGSGLKRYDRETGLFASWQQQPDNPNSLSGDYLDSIWEDHDFLDWNGWQRAEPF